MRLHLGIDDTDSRNGGCTTYVAAVLVEKLARIGCKFFDYPNIIRLNPNIPYKTRGNAAVAIRLRVSDEGYDQIEQLVLGTIEKLSRIGEKGTDPALVILRGNPTNEVRRLSYSALTGIVSPAEAFRTLRKSRAVAALYGARLGLVGATAAIGQTLDGDHTFELVAYRTRRRCGKPRLVDAERVKLMDRLTATETFNNYDAENERVLITPHGLDPVLLGIRGETAEGVLRAFRMLRIREPVERWVIFRTNHGTDAHLRQQNRKIQLHAPAVVRGVVCEKPKRIRGGHVFLSIVADDRKLNCAAFEPTGRFRNVVAQLTAGDEVSVFGGVHSNAGSVYTINLEKMFVHRLIKPSLMKNPICARCSKRFKSAGNGKGFKCVRCGLRRTDTRKPVTFEERPIVPGWYLPSLKAHRHLTKPLSRYGLEKTWDSLPPTGVWHEP